MTPEAAAVDISEDAVKHWGRTRADTETRIRLAHYFANISGLSVVPYTAVKGA